MIRPSGSVRLTRFPPPGSSISWISLAPGALDIISNYDIVRFVWIKHVKSLIIIFSLLILVLLLYLIITKKKTEKEEKIIEAEYEEVHKKNKKNS